MVENGRMEAPRFLKNRKTSFVLRKKNSFYALVKRYVNRFQRGICRKAAVETLFSRLQVT